MNESFSKKFTLTTNSYDCYDRIRPSTFVDVMQNTAGDHADILGVGYKPFIDKGYIWVIVKNYFEVLSYDKNIQEIEVVTSIVKPRLFELPRDYIIKNTATNEIICKGQVTCVIFDLKSKKVVDPSEFTSLKTDSKGMFERIKRLPKIDIKDYEYFKDFMVTFSMIDHNMHMNNTRALDIFLDTFRFKENEVIESIQVEYEAQAYLDNLLSLYKKKDLQNYSLIAKIENQFWRIDAKTIKI